MDRVFAFILGLAVCLVLTGAAVALVDRQRNAESARNDCEWARLVQAAYDRGYETGIKIGRSLSDDLVSDRSVGSVQSVQSLAEEAPHAR